MRELIGDGVNGFTADWEEDGFEIWDYLCQTSSNRKRLTDRLVFESATCSCSIDSTQKLWQSLISGYGSDIEELTSVIVENIEALQSMNPEDLVKYFNWRFLDHSLLPKFELDQTVVKFLFQIENGKINTEGTIGAAVEQIMHDSSNKKLKLDFTFKVINHTLESKSSQFPVLNRLKELPNSIFEDGQLKREELEEIDEFYEVENWNSIAKKEDV